MKLFYLPIFHRETNFTDNTSVGVEEKENVEVEEEEGEEKKEEVWVLEEKWYNTSTMYIYCMYKYVLYVYIHFISIVIKYYT